jgi:6-phosphogluconate dehydrogenase
MQVGVLGLGKMGRLLAEKLMRDNHQVTVWNRSKGILEEMRMTKSEFIINKKLTIAHSLENLQESLLQPRVFWLMLPAGEVTEEIFQSIMETLSPGDIIIDGGNANFKDSDRRAALAIQKGAKFLGIGVSGGVHMFENGASLMVGGDKDAYEYIRPLLDTLSHPNGAHTYFGPGGAGHFVKMVHNGVEYGIMQAIAEGFGVLAKSEYKYNLFDVGHLWQRGSIVRSFLLDMALNALAKDPSLSETDGKIDATGEAEWTVAAAKDSHVPVPVIEKALEFRARSQYDQGIQDTVVAKLVGAIRKEFGGHAAIHVEEKSPQQQ